MLDSEIIDKIKLLITSVLEKNQFSLVEIKQFYQGNTLFLRILVDRAEGGISLDECANLNNQIGIILDEKDILQQRYALEVSSPGLDRPLKTKSDFLRCINRNVKFFVREPINGKMELEGVISKVDDDSVYINVASETLVIPLSKITKAKQVIKSI